MCVPIELASRVYRAFSARTVCVCTPEALPPSLHDAAPLALRLDAHGVLALPLSIILKQEKASAVETTQGAVEKVLWHRRRFLLQPALARRTERRN
jgi:hypothetical protein